MRLNSSKQAQPPEDARPIINIITISISSFIVVMDIYIYIYIYIL